MLHYRCMHAKERHASCVCVCVRARARARERERERERGGDIILRAIFVGGLRVVSLLIVLLRSVLGSDVALSLVLTLPGP